MLRYPVALVMACMPAMSVAGQPVIDWANPAGGDFHDPFNWAGTVVPTPGDDASFGLGTVYTVGFSAGAETAGLTVVDDHVTFQLGGNTYEIDGQVRVEGPPRATVSPRLTVGGGTLVVDDLQVGEPIGTEGFVEVVGADAIMNVGDIKLGGSGSGRLDVAGGAMVTFADSLFRLGAEPGSTGTMTVSGTGSLVQVNPSGTGAVGGLGSGSLTICDGAAWNSPSRALTLGEQEGSSGTLTVDGPDTEVDIRNLWVGDAGAGHLILRNGAHLIARQSDNFVAVDPTATGEILATDPGTFLEINTDFQLRGNGTVVVSNGARCFTYALLLQPGAGTTASVQFTGPGTLVDTTRITLGAGAAGTSMLLVDDGAFHRTSSQDLHISNGTVTVTGDGSRLRVGETFVGSGAGLGMLVVQSGAWVQSQDDSVIGSSASGLARVEGEDALWAVSGMLTVGSAEGGESANGALDMSSGGRTTCTSMTLGLDADSNGFVQVNDADLDVSGNVLVGVDGFGSVRVTHGTFSVGGLYDQRIGSSLEVTVGEGSTPIVATTAAVRGELTVKLMPGFEPYDGWSVDLVTATASMSSNLTRVTLPDTEGGPAMHLIFHTNRLELLAGQLPGDANDDGDVNVLDLVEVIVHWGPCAAPCPADLNGDGQVDMDDLNEIFLSWYTITWP